MNYEDLIKMGQEAGFRIGGGRDGPDDVLGTGYNLERFAALVAAAALAEPTINEMETVEPVAWQWLNTGTFRKRLPKTAVAENWTPIYAAPRNRKPLTDADIETVADSLPADDLGMPTTWHLRLARAIERAHGIGGEG
tara:strand:+ start:117 stop:530 length:414 start_codon:yes stop_codon:yes gene_type:complete